MKSTAPATYAEVLTVTAIAAGTSMASPHVAGVAALCISTGACTGTPAQIIQKLRTDAQNYTGANPGYGFTSPSGRYYGFLTRASY